MVRHPPAMDPVLMGLRVGTQLLAVMVPQVVTPHPVATAPLVVTPPPVPMVPQAATVLRVATRPQMFTLPLAAIPPLVLMVPPMVMVAPMAMVPRVVIPRAAMAPLAVMEHPLVQRQAAMVPLPATWVDRPQEGRIRRQTCLTVTEVLGSAPVWASGAAPLLPMGT